MSYSHGMQSLASGQGSSDPECSLSTTGESALSNLMTYSQGTWNNYNDLPYIGNDEPLTRVQTNYQQHQQVPSV